MDSCRLFQVLVESRKHRECSAISLDSLLFSITRDAERSLNAYSRSASPALKLHAEHRLAFVNSDSASEFTRLNKCSKY